MNGRRINRAKWSGLVCNVRSFVKNCSAVVTELFLHNLDLAVLTETWLSSENELKPLLGVACSHYVGVRCDRLTKKGGGILLLLRKAFSYNEVFSESVPNSYEILVCDVNHDDNVFRVICVYRTPGCSASKSHQLTKAISDYSAINITTVLLGDFNLPDLMSNRCGYISRCFSSVFETHGFEHLVLAPTRRNSVLDLLLCNKAGFVSDVQIGPPIGSSDHAMVTFQMDLKHKNSEIRWIRNYKCADYYQIGIYLASIDWVGIMSSGSTVDQLYETLLTIIHHTIEMFVPMRRMGEGEKGVPDHLRRLNSYRFYCWNKACVTNRQEDWALYETLSIKHAKALRRYNMYIERKVMQSKDRRAFYRFISTRSGSDNVIPTLVNSNGELISSDKEKADLLGEVFQKVYNKSQVSLDCSETDYDEDLPRFPK